jgi:uncharacterized protein YbjT (DUF2867 family)
MILVTGASGQLGGRVARLLREQGHPTRLMVRNPDRAPRLSGAEIVAGDYEKPETLGPAFEGISRALIVSGHAEPMERAKLHRNMFVAAAEAKVAHIVYTSFQGVAPDSKFPFARDHHQTELYLKATGLPFTALRDNLYMDFIAEMFNEEGILLGPAGAGRTGWVSRDDVARCVVAALLNPDRFAGTHDVTGPEALSMAETARIMSEIQDKELRYEDETMEAGRAWRGKYDVPAWEVECWLGSYAAIKYGELETLSDTVERMTGRQPISVREFFTRSG